MKILGINKGITVFGKQLRHGGAAAAMDGRVVALAEERATRIKYAGGYEGALSAILAAEDLDLDRDFDVIAVSSCCETEADALVGHQLEGDPRIVAVNHHLSHAALAFYGSGFQRAAVVVADGGGNVLLERGGAPSEWWRSPREQLTCYVGERGAGLEVVDRDFDQPLATGLGEVYRAFTYFLGWHSSVYGARTMALAGHGRRGVVGAGLFDIIDGQLQSPIDNDPSRPIEMVLRIGHTLGVDFGEPRAPNGTVLQVHKDVAAFVQDSLEEALLHKLGHLRKRLRVDSLCIAGGIALNVVANARLLELFPGGVYVPSAPADDGQALGNVYVLANVRSRSSTILPMTTTSDAFLGPARDLSSRSIVDALAQNDVKDYVVFETSDYTELIVDVLAAGSPVCLFRGRSEYGPRALGDRSILADPRRGDAVVRLNSVKDREWFMPFAPAVLAERVSEWFEPAAKSPFMSFALRARDRALKELPAVVNLDGTARVQTVDESDGSPLHAILAAFESKTGVPVLLNTSFNQGGKPIVESAEHAIDAFKEMPINVLGIGRFVVMKALSPDLSDLPVTAAMDGFNMEVYRRGSESPIVIQEASAPRIIRRLQEVTRSVVFVRTELPLYEEYLDWLRQGRKVTTIRFRKGGVEVPYSSVLPLFKTKDFGPGDRSRPTELVDVSALRYHRFGELTQEHAANDGFVDYAHMRAALKRIYRDLGDEDWVTVYDIRLVEPQPR